MKPWRRESAHRTLVFIERKIAQHESLDCTGLDPSRCMSSVLPFKFADV